MRERPLDAKALESAWGDLFSEDAPRAHRATWALVAGARQSLPFLRERLLGPPRVKGERIQRWIADLDSDEFAVRDSATAEITNLDRAAEPALRQALAKKPSLEQRRRIERLLERLTAPGRNLHAARVTTVLEQIGTAEALADEPAETLLSREARASVKRMRGK